MSRFEWIIKFCDGYIVHTSMFDNGSEMSKEFECMVTSFIDDPLSQCWYKFRTEIGEQQHRIGCCRSSFVHGIPGKDITISVYVYVGIAYCRYPKITP